MLVRDRMTPDPTCGYPDMPVTEAQSLMRDEGVRHLPIMDDKEKLVGLITQRSLLSALPSDVSNFSRFEISYTLAKIKVDTVMVKDVITIKEDIPIETAARVMADHKIGCLPVLDGKDLVGIITDSDLFNTMVSLLGSRRKGTRVTVLQPDRVGEVARLTNAIAEEGGYLSVCVGYYPEDITDSWVSVCKVLNLERDKLQEVINQLEGTKVLDIREI
ncbi:MAG: CBS domain-containing protein [Anaerolineales bacterium]